MTDARIVSALQNVTTATLTTILFKKGLRNVWLRGTAPLAPGQARVVGPAFTLRFLPQREDLATPAAWSSPTSTRAAVEAMPAGCVVVADTAGISDAGIFGDILCARMQQRQVSGLVTDGSIRDRAGILTTDLPVWCSGAAAPPAVAQLGFVGWQDPIACGGVAVYPGDTIVADEDGAIVIPAALVEEVAAVAEEQERTEAWILRQIKQGASLTGMYPLSEENLARFKAEGDL
ncbi:ribonuclease activity regulator RraA [Bordetella genomosp. 13]|uniref:ribonuclease activity regulator RraA n=1 Tax=Bordetella genomosp. 13 TaxID=463040 RepID=UPI00119CDBCD|nr:ribonuclease activity regulator RraA [Bordetella genomosp. 13]